MNVNNLANFKKNYRSKCRDNVSNIKYGENIFLMTMVLEPAFGTSTNSTEYLSSSNNRYQVTLSIMAKDRWGESPSVFFCTVGI